MPVKFADIIRLKMDLISTLAQCATSQILGRGLAEDFFAPVLYFCMGCHEHNMKPIDQFVPLERAELETNLGLALPRFEENLTSQFSGLGVESAMRVRQLRSGLQFLQDDIVENLSETVKTKMNDLMKCMVVEDIDEDLERWRVNRDWDPYEEFDLRFVPLSHHWWVDGQRRESMEKFGNIQPS